MKKSLLVGALLVSVGTSAMAATTGQIDLQGTVAQVLNIAVTDTEANNDVTLGTGSSAITQKVGEIEIDSNNLAGFSLTFASTNGFELRKDGTETAEFAHVDYGIQLANAAGTLGSSINEPTLTNIEDDADLTLEFTNDDGKVGPTDGRTYDVEAIVSDKTGLASGTYTDTIEITIAEII